MPHQFASVPIFHYSLASISNVRPENIVPFPWKRVLLIAPHPDDESLAGGGLIRRALGAGAAVRVVFATDGEYNHWPQRYLERRWRVGEDDRKRWGTRRRLEAVAALKILGVCEGDIRFLGLPDNRLRQLGPSELLRSLKPHVRGFAPDLIVSPSNCDLHGDHRMVARSVETMVADDHSTFDVLTYVTHGVPNEDRRLYEIALSPDDLEAKREAILCHGTQLALSRSRLLRFADTKEVFYDAGDPEPRLAGIKRLWEICFAGPFPTSRRDESGQADDLAMGSPSHASR
ncbi:MAG TPA: PIG-L family deacetylase [Thermoanaerobaculia bacterium]|nr:PIG-L family deacetylase [Thermoanaerobaculia bacterium]